MVISRRRGQKRPKQREGSMRGTPPTLLALKMVRGVMNQGMQRSLEAGVERQKNILS